METARLAVGPGSDIGLGRTQIFSREYARMQATKAPHFARLLLQGLENSGGGSQRILDSTQDRYLMASPADRFSSLGNIQGHPRLG